MGTHLKEYTYQELKEQLQQVGFKNIYAVLAVPPKITSTFGIYFKPKASRAYLNYLIAVEKLISLFPGTVRRKAAMLSMAILFPPSIFIIAQKGW